MTLLGKCVPWQPARSSKVKTKLTSSNLFLLEAKQFRLISEGGEVQANMMVVYIFLMIK